MQSQGCISFFCFVMRRIRSKCAADYEEKRCKCAADYEEKKSRLSFEL